MITVLIIETVTAFGLVGFSCEIGQRFTTEFDDIADEIDSLKWYIFPIKVQKMLPMVILNVQQELAIECFGSILCVRESFTNVSNTHRVYIPDVAFQNNIY